MAIVIHGDALEESATSLVCKRNGQIHQQLESAITSEEPIRVLADYGGSMRGLAQPVVRARLHRLNHPNFQNLISISYSAKRSDLYREESTPGGHGSNTVLALTHAVCATIPRKTPESPSVILTPLSWRNKELMDAILATAVVRIRIHQEVNCRAVPTLAIATKGETDRIDRYLDSHYTLPFWKP